MNAIRKIERTEKMAMIDECFDQANKKKRKETKTSQIRRKQNTHTNKKSKSPRKRRRLYIYIYEFAFDVCWPTVFRLQSQSVYYIESTIRIDTLTHKEQPIRASQRQRLRL